jgi:hypothetical protein
MLANDELLSGADPKQVVEYYNQLSEVAPRLAAHPLAARSLVRRWVGQGGVDPHEVDQLLGMENRMKEQSKPDMDMLRLTGGLPAGPGAPPPPDKK